MSDILGALEKALKNANVTEQRFRQLVSRLLGRGILCYGDSPGENELYNDALRALHVLRDYFACMGARLEHDYDLKYFRLYPPGGESAAVQLDDDESADHALRET